MGDYILREIDRIGALLRALLDRAGALRHSPERERLAAEVRSELTAGLGIDPDALLADPDALLADRLSSDHGFTEEHLELAAELLTDLAGASSDDEERRRLAAAALTIYRRLDEAGAPVSFNRYFILNELNRYSDR